jgi:hypothetical protein
MMIHRSGNPFTPTQTTTDALELVREDTLSVNNVKI